MARVPFEGTPNISPSTQPLGTQSIPAGPMDFGAGLGQGVSDLGKTLVQGGDMLAQHAVAFQQLDNMAEGDKLNSEFMKGMVTLGNGDDGYYTKPGEAAYKGLPTYLQQLDNLRNSVASSASNPIVAKEFQANSRRMASYEMIRASEFARQGRKQWLVGSATSRAQSAMDLSTANPLDEGLATQAITSLHEAMGMKGGAEGWDSDTLNQMTSEAISKLQFDRVAAIASGGDLIHAQQFYNQHFNDIVGNDKLRLQRFFQVTMEPKILDNVAANIMSGGAQSVKPMDFASALTAQEATPMGVMSAKGAMGAMQVQPAAAMQAASELGIPYDAQKLLHDPEYNRKIGTQYAADMLAKFGGNLPAAAAAYNMGPGAVNDLIKRVGDPSLGQISTEDFLKQLDKFHQTKGDMTSKTVGDYVRGVLAHVGPQQPGTPPIGEDPRSHLKDWFAQADNTARNLFPNDDAAPAKLRELLLSRTAQIVKGNKDIQDAAFTNLQGFVIDHPQITTLAQLQSAYPGAMSDFSNTNPGARNTLNTMLAANARGTKVVSTPQSEARMHQLMGTYLTNPAEFSQIDISHESILPAEDRKKLLGLQQKLATNAPDTGIQRALAQAQLWGAPVKADGDSYTQFAGALHDEMMIFQSVHGRQPSDQDIRSITQRLMLKSGGGWFGIGAKAAYETQPSLADVPEQDIRQIEAMHQLQFGAPANEGQILYWYGMMQRRRNAK